MKKTPLALAPCLSGLRGSRLGGSALGRKNLWVAGFIPRWVKDAKYVYEKPEL